MENNGKTEKLEELIEKKNWNEQPEWTRKHICPICEAVLRNGDELIQGFHTNCFEGL